MAEGSAVACSQDDLVCAILQSTGTIDWRQYGLLLQNYGNQDSATFLKKVVLIFTAVSASNPILLRIVTRYRLYFVLRRNACRIFERRLALEKNMNCRECLMQKEL
jgi:hypothetical protein